MRARASVTAALFGFALAAGARASSERVVLVRPEARDPVLLDAWNRLAAELRIDRFSVQIVEDGEVDTSPASLSAVACKFEALAAIELVEETGQTAVDVWLVDRVSGKTTMRTVAVQKGADASSVLAIRAVDLLRASLREFENEERPPPDVVGVERGPVPQAVIRLAARPEPKWRLRAEAVLLEEGTRFGVALGPALAASYRVAERFELGVLASGPLLGAQLETRLGSATAHQELGLVEARFSLVRSTRFDVALNAAAGVHLLSAEGQPSPPLASRSAHVTSFAGSLGVGADFALSPRIAIGATIRAMVTAPGVGVAVATESATLPLPVVVGTLGIAVAL
jgi:hypothetical protein